MMVFRSGNARKWRHGQNRGKTDMREASGTTGEHRLIDVSMLVLPTVHSSALYGAYDILSTADIYWSLQHRQIRRGTNRMRVQLVGASLDAVEAWNGVMVQPSASISSVQKTDLLYIPAIGPADGNIPPTEPRVCRWIRQQYDGGAIIATSCSGSLLLAEAGLLDGQPATTHWAYADTFARRFPATRLCAERALVLAGTGQRIVTAGGGSLWAELILYLVARLLGREAAMHAAKFYLVDWARQDQLPYSQVLGRMQHTDGLIRKSQEYITQHANEPDVLSCARAISRLQERTFERRFKFVTGVSPGRYIQEIRIEMAKEAIERRTDPVDEIACEVGYADPAFFRRLFKRMVGVSPSAYRRRMTPPA